MNVTDPSSRSEVFSAPERRGTVRLLKGLDLFSKCTEGDLEKLMGAMPVRTVEPGETIVRQGDPGSEMFVLLDGEVEVTKETAGVSTKLATMRNGGVVGEFALLDQKPRSATVTAVSRTTLLVIGREEFFGQMARFPDILLKILASISGKVRNGNERYIEELSSKNEELRVAYDQLKDLDERKSKFIDLASHELLTPLTVLLLYFGFLKEPASRQDQRFVKTTIDTIEENLGRLTSIVEDLIQLSSHGETKKPPVRVRIRPTAILADAVAQAVPALKVRSIGLESHCQEDLPDVLVEEGRTKQALLNVLMTSIRMTPDGGTISLVARRWSNEREWIEIAVTDTAPAMDGDDSTRIFEPFYEPGNVLDHFSGTHEHMTGGLGLSLAVAKRFVEENGGKIDATGLAGGWGNRYRLLLPAAP